MKKNNYILIIIILLILALIVSCTEKTTENKITYPVVTIKNNTGEDIEIFTQSDVLWPLIENWHFWTDIGVGSVGLFPRTILFEADSVFSEDWSFGNTLKAGEHELTFSAVFILNRGKQNEQRIEILSDPITLTVTKEDTHREDFVLTIRSLRNASLTGMDGWNIDIELQNNSGECHEITHFLLYQPFIANWSKYNWLMGRPFDPSQMHTKFLETDGFIEAVALDGREGPYMFLPRQGLYPGTHELRYRAVFYLNWGQENQERVEVWSNAITITVWY